MPIGVNTGTKSIPLKLAKELTNEVNRAWDDGTFLENVTPVTKDLLRYWFSNAFTDTRNINFHLGQRQAILNTIYTHEVLKIEKVSEIYLSINEAILSELDNDILEQEKYKYPKYCMKMATGTGKTWVMSALLLWQYLNAKNEEKKSGRYTKNFLLIAPGLIVYERLLDAYLGKENQKGIREFETSDFKKFEQLFIPPSYKETVFSFLQSSVVAKQDIGRKITGDGLIAITNWHLLSDIDDEEVDLHSPFDNTSQIITDLLPITPGKSSGHALEVLDNQYLSGKELEFLINLPDIVVFNDEAHHIHEFKSKGEIIEVEWQKSLNRIASTKGNSFIQIDFSATPYEITGSGQKRTKHYFPYIIVDFDLKTAIRRGLVKTITLDKRKEITGMDLDFKAIREGRNVIGLSAGQKLMLRAGLQKLRILEKQFAEYTEGRGTLKNKHPKMLVICEDTQVAPEVTKFLTSFEDLSDDDVIQIDSDKKGSIPAKEWSEVKQRLFNVDQYSKPKIIVSVLMLREGFDVNNICVIVPLRSSEAPILLEQIIGRGLRLMWREPEFLEMKEENRIRLLEKKEQPTNYLDILSIVEHPAFMQFYDDLMKEGLAAETNDLPDKGDVLGDIIHVGLKENYKQFDMYIPFILNEKEEYLRTSELTVDDLSPYGKTTSIHFSIDQLRKMTVKEGETFYSEELTVRTRFGDYQVTGEIFNAKSYNDFLSKMVVVITSSIGKVGIRKTRNYPTIQINHVELVRIIDDFIRTKLFEQPFNPLENNNWKILIVARSGIIEHITKEMSKIIYQMQNNIDISEAVVIKRYFSEVPELRMRERYSIEFSKTIYARLQYPSNKGQFEKDFMIFCDSDANTQSFLKINEHYHTFAGLNYIRTDGMLASYYPDFIVKYNHDIYLVETKAQDQLENENVKQKQNGALDWIKQVNELNPDDRMNGKWHYILLGDSTFYSMRDDGAGLGDIFDYCELTKARIEGTLF
ncbi:DEAD/DEAH box helicase family protein [Schinkia azotoformans]|uniref:DEAD/DEAH box helicase family protein n=1 Tax=Schinkia azotoformans TaxID=1454 RepID=UPI002DB63523|nr:DEAD/DEAH box helicase family protein [Schinkia azotoformans]MEC1788616.1 DEAD/DEAH box helicase family protein [Schinkia azotoformans]MED4419935.1 DEAD/DEAH box helicase family protein [Schinkia azotoformans]